MYQAEALFREVITELQHNGFELVSLEPNTFDHARGAIREVNAMLVGPATKPSRLKPPRLLNVKSAAILFCY